MTTVPLNDPKETFFRRVLVVSTAMAFGGMLASLAVVGRDREGLRFDFHWSAPLLFILGAFGAFLFWRFMFRFESGGDDLMRRRLKQSGAAMLLVAFACFLYPLRLVSPDKRAEVMIGIGLALTVLSGFGWLIYQTIQWVEASSRAEEARVEHDESRR
jgi:hypothetical protein